MKRNFWDKLKRYRLFLLLACLNIILLIFYPDTGVHSLGLTWSNLTQLLSVLPPIFILLGLLDVWVSKETMMKYMGSGSGAVGVLLAFFLGSAAAGPLYAAFPVAGMLLKKGAKLSNIFIFLGAWSTTKAPMIMFEASALGPKFMLLRLALNLVGIPLIAFFTEKMLSREEQDALYRLHIDPETSDA